MSPDPAKPAAPADNRFRRRDKNRPLRAPTGQASVFQLRKNIVRWIEIEDVLFHFDSAVLMPDAESDDEPGTPDEERISGLSVIRAAYMQAADNPKQKLLIAGHTDTAGGFYNEDLNRAPGFVRGVGREGPWVKSRRAGRTKTSSTSCAAAR
jgi:outer membrane protein OmpA-like peptidoglycan-associated protein